MTEQLTKPMVKLPIPGGVAMAIHRAMSNCCKDGGRPDEIWLGPECRKELEKAINDMFVQNGSSPIYLHSGLEYCGMAVKFMQQEGVRVGKTYEG